MNKFIVFILICALYFFTGVGLTNSGDAPQYRLTQSLVENHTACLPPDDPDIYPDVARKGDCVLSGRNPGESFVAVPFFLIAKSLKKVISLPYNGNREGVKDQSGIEASTAIVNAIFGALCVIMVYKLSLLFFESPVSSAVTGALFAFGTLNWKYSSIFYRHTLSEFFVLTNIYYLYILIRSKHLRVSHLSTYSVSLAMCYFVEPTLVLYCTLSLLTYLLVSLRNKLSLNKTIYRTVFIVIIGFCINLPVLVYNYKIFGNPFDSGWGNQEVNTWLSDKKLTFSTPYLSSLGVNLFSPSEPLPETVFSDLLKNNENLMLQQGYDSAKSFDYKGVFFQSPYLFLVFISFFVLRKKNDFLFLVLAGLAATYFSAKYIVFYSPNSYDTRFFLVLYAIFSILVTPAVSWFLKSNSSLFRYVASFLLFIVSIVSVFNGWQSAVENYGPHISGEKRILANDLIATSHPVDFIIQTLPNLFNYRIFIIYTLLFYLIYRTFLFLIYKSSFLQRFYQNKFSKLSTVLR